MTIREICTEYGYTQSDLARRFGIPLRTIQNWYNDVRTPPDYIPSMMIEILEQEKNGGC